MSYPSTQRIREERRSLALLRQERYNLLSLQEKFEKLPLTGAKKQREKLSKLLSAEKK